MKMRFVFVTLLSAIMLLSVNIAVANVGDPLDIDKDGRITENDAESVIDHINFYGAGPLSDAEAEFPFNSEDLEDEADETALEDILHNWVFFEFVYDLTPADLELLTYRVTWERKDVNDDGFVTAIDALMIINWLNSH